MFRAPATFGQQTPGCKYRQNQCYTLDAADLLVVDYDQHDTFTHFRRNTEAEITLEAKPIRQKIVSSLDD